MHFQRARKGVRIWGIEKGGVEFRKERAKKKGGEEIGNRRGGFQCFFLCFCFVSFGKIKETWSFYLFLSSLCEKG